MNDDSAIRVLCLIIGGIVAVLALSMLTGCMEFRQGVAAIGQAKQDVMTLAEKAADDKLASSVEWMCLHASTRSLAKEFTAKEQLEGFRLLCGHPMLLTLPDLVEQMRREREQVETICEPAEMKAAREPEVGP